MPITPLHLAAGLPVQQWLKGRFSLWAFITTNVIIDVEPGLIMFFGMERLGYPLHGILHTLAGATCVALLVAACGRSWPILAGAMFGAWSHLFLDALVHTDVHPLWPVLDGNPLYMAWMEPVSLVCLIVVAWYGIPWLFLLVRDTQRRICGWISSKLGGSRNKNGNRGDASPPSRKQEQ